MAISRSVRPSLVARATPSVRFDWLVPTVKHRETISRPPDRPLYRLGCCKDEPGPSHGDCAVVPMDAGYGMWLVREAQCPVVFGRRCVERLLVAPPALANLRVSLSSLDCFSVEPEANGTKTAHPSIPATTPSLTAGPSSGAPTSARHRAGEKREMARHRLALVTLMR